MITVESAIDFATDNCCTVTTDFLIQNGGGAKAFSVSKGGEKLFVRQCYKGAHKWRLGKSKITMTRAQCIVEAVRELSKGKGLY